MNAIDVIQEESDQQSSSHLLHKEEEKETEYYDDEDDEYGSVIGASNDYKGRLSLADIQESAIIERRNKKIPP